LVATYCFAFQIYCDFSGYSDIARGVSRVYGIELMNNFDAPYFAKSISEFWARWHISLSTWFRDYVYIPLGGNRVSLGRNFLNLFVVFLLSGFWHGANWTFIIWGALHGVYLITGRVWGIARERLTIGNEAGPLRRGLALLLTFHLVLVAWVFFRARDLATALDIAQRMLVPTGRVFYDPILVQCALGVLIVTAGDWLIRRTDYWNNLDRYPVTRFTTSLAMLFGISLFGVENGAQFIYFQF
jgi:D-alanyl-lipoteichoic acid acyltransferase DltB (MBOAT superfamily)